MKKMMISMILSLLLVASFALADSPNGVGSPDVECQAHGFDYGIAKYEYVNGGYTLDEGIFHNYAIAISVNSDARSIIWKAEPAVAGVLLKTMTDHYVVGVGGTRGVTDMDIKNDISHVTFCGDEPTDVPEFGVVAAAGILAIAGLFIYQRRK